MVSGDSDQQSVAKNRFFHRLNKAKKTWASACLTIYCSRRFENLLHRPKKKSNKPSSDSDSDSFIIDIAGDDPFTSYSIDPDTLADLVKQKSIDQVRELGGSRGIARALNVDFRQGINPENADDMKQRISAFGSNTYAKPPENGFFHFVRESFQDPTIFILVICALLSLGFGIKVHGAEEGWYEGGSILAAIFLVVSVSSVRNFQQSHHFSKLSKVSLNRNVEVVINGRSQQVSIFDIVVGDVVCLKIGDQVPADGVFLEGYSLRVDGSSMTGESEVNHGQNPFLMSGAKVSDGYGRMIVTSVGMQTAWGEMMSSVSNDSDEKTPLQSRIDQLTLGISKAGLLVAFVVLLFRSFAGNTKDGDGKKGCNGSSFADVMNGALRIVFVAIPEGLPLAVTLTLAYSMKRMMSDQAMVRKLSACETMGSATIICTDKTGTLTLNELTVTEFWLGRDSMEVYDEIAVNVVNLLHQAVGMNTTANVFRTENGESEKAILSWAASKLHVDMERVKEDHSVLQVETLNSEKKRSGVMIRKNSDSSVHVHWRGAAEMILAMCSHYYDSGAEVSVLDELERENFLKIIEGMASSSLRCIAFAHKQVWDSNVGEIENNLILLGIVGLQDPCRPGVKEAVEDIQQAGVKVKMFTGDNVFTARAVAVECGILPANLTGNLEGSNYLVVEGSEFRNYTDEERMAKVEKIAVMARCSPSDKLLMVKCLRQKGHVVAVMGDTPALKEADIGLSMGIQGTEVAKESSDIVILDDSFTSVSNALRWGRCVHENIRMFIQFQLTVNVSAAVINLVAAVSAVEGPLSAVQLLWVNLIMDTLGALALATEGPMRGLMNRPPIDPSQPLITNIMWRNLLSQAVYQIAAVLTMQFKGEEVLGVSRKVNDTLIFNTFVLCQVLNEFNARRLEKKNVFRGVLKNRMFVGIVVATVVLQVLMVELLKRFANTERLGWGQWGLCVGLAVASWPVGWVVKCIPVPEKPFFSYTS